MTGRHEGVVGYRVFPSGDAGGNLAGVVLTADWPDDMAQLARRTALPTVAFAKPGRAGVIDTRMFTVDGEIASCGHASAAVAAEAYRTGSSQAPGLLVRSPGGDIVCRAGGDLDRPSVTMTLSVSAWSVEAPPRELAELCVTRLDEIPVARVETGLSHLIAMVADTTALAAIDLDHDRWRSLGRRIGVDTIGLVALGDDGVVHLRDICAPIGDTEEAASGTTATAVTWHLHRLGRGDAFEIRQGVEMGRPSLLRTAIVGAAVEVTGRVDPVEP